MKARLAETMKSRIHVTTAALLLGASFSVQTQTASTVRFSSAQYVATEAYWGPLIRVEVSGPVPAGASVTLRVTAGTAAEGEDFSLFPGCITFPAGSTSASNAVEVMVRADGISEGPERFTLALTNLTGGLTLGTPATAEVLIQDSGGLNPAHLDPDFDPGLMPWAVLVQPDGRILLSTFDTQLTGGEGFVVLRLLPDGSRDPTWTAPRFASGSLMHTLVLQPNNQVLILSQYVGRSWIQRLNPDGSVDPTFRVDGDLSGPVAVQPDGRMVARTGINLVRLNADGSIDPSFQTTVEGSPLLVSPEGRLFVAGSGGLTCLNADGAPDPEFTADPGIKGAQQLALQLDGKLLVLDHAGGWGYRLLRLNRDGRPDGNFTPRQFPESSGTRFITAPDSRMWILANGYLLCLQSDGRPDSGWWPSRVASEHNWTTEFAGGPVLLSAPDGNLLFCDYGTTVNGQPRHGLAKLLVNVPAQRCELDAASALVLESAGRVALKLVRCGDVTQPLTVLWQTDGGTAESELHYRAAGGAVTFGANESAGSFELEVLNNTLPDKDRTVRLSLEVDGGAGPVLPPLELTIANDDLGFAPDGIRRLANGKWYLRATGCPIAGGHAELEHSSDLRTWQPSPTDPLRFPFPDAVVAGEASHDFFRLVLVPEPSP